MARVAQKKEQTIELRLKELKLLTGIVPIKYREGSSLLTNKVAAEIKEKIADNDGKSAKTRDAEQEFRSSLYAIDAEEGIYGFPAAGIMKCLVHAGGRIGGETMTVLRAALVVEPETNGLVRIIGPEPILRTDLIRTDGGKLQVANRAEFKNWRMKVRVTYNADLLDYNKPPPPLGRIPSFHPQEYLLPCQNRLQEVETNENDCQQGRRAASLARSDERRGTAGAGRVLPARDQGIARQTDRE